jgi:hypothetical protein
MFNVEETETKENADSTDGNVMVNNLCFSNRKKPFVALEQTAK